MSEMSNFVSYSTTAADQTTQTPLLANANVLLANFHADRAQYIAGSVYSDQAGTLIVEQSFDGGQNWDIQNTIAVTAATVSQGFKIDVLAPVLQISYTNGGTNQGVFRLFARTYSTGW